MYRKFLFASFTLCLAATTWAQTGFSTPTKSLAPTPAAAPSTAPIRTFTKHSNSISAQANAPANAQIIQQQNAMINGQWNNSNSTSNQVPSPAQQHSVSPYGFDANSQFMKGQIVNGKALIADERFVSGQAQGNNATTWQQGQQPNGQNFGNVQNGNGNWNQNNQMTYSQPNGSYPQSDGSLAPVPTTTPMEDGQTVVQGTGGGCNGSNGSNFNGGYYQPTRSYSPNYYPSTQPTYSRRGFFRGSRGW